MQQKLSYCVEKKTLIDSKGLIQKINEEKTEISHMCIIIID